MSPELQPRSLKLGPDRRPVHTPALCELRQAGAGLVLRNRLSYLVWTQPALALTGERWRTGQGRNTWHVLTVAERREKGLEFPACPC